MSAVNSNSSFLSNLLAKEQPNVKKLPTSVLLESGQLALRKMNNENGDSTLFDELWRSIEKSKIDGNKKTVQKAKEAIEKLNLARFSFSGKDLSSLRIPEADLSRGIFHRTNFTGADLRGVKFQDAYLANAVLAQANLKGADFGPLHGEVRNSSECGNKHCLAVQDNIVVVGKSCSNSSEGEIHLWFIENGYWTLKSSHKTEEGVYYIAFSENRECLITVGNSSIRKYNLSDLLSPSTRENQTEEKSSFNGMKKSVKPDYISSYSDLIPKETIISNPLFLHSKKHLIFATETEIKQYDLIGKKLIQTWTSEQFPRFTHLVFCHEAGLLAGIGSAIAIWTYDRKEPFKLFHPSISAPIQIHGEPKRFAFSNDGKMFAIATQQRVYVFNTETKELIHLWTWGVAKYDIQALSFTTNNKSLITVCQGDDPRIWNLPAHIANNSAYRIDEISTNSKEEITLARSNQFFFTLKMHVLRGWDALTGECIWDFKAWSQDYVNQSSVSPVDRFSVSNDTRHLLIQCNTTVSLLSWSSIFAQISYIQTFAQPSGIKEMGFLSNTQVIIIREDQVETYNIETQQLKNHPELKASAILKFALLNEGGYLGIVTREAIEIWNLKIGTSDPFIKLAFTYIVDEVKELQFSSNNELLVRTEDRVYLWDFTQKRAPLSFKGFDEIKRVPIAYHYFLLRSRQTPPGVFALNKNGYVLVHSLLAFPKDDGKNSDNLVLHDDYGHKKKWSKTKKIIYTTDQRIAFSCTQMAVHPSRSIVAIGGDNGTIQLWNPLNGQLLDILYGHIDEITHLLFSDDGYTLLSGSKDSVLKRWSVAKDSDQITLQWQTDPPSLVVSGVAIQDATLDEKNKKLLAGELYKTSQSVENHVPIDCVTENFYQPYLFPKKGNTCDGTAQIKSANLDIAIMHIHRKILKNEDNFETVKTFLTFWYQLKNSTPSDFHFILEAMKDIGESICNQVPANPISVYLVHHIYNKASSKQMMYTRQLLNLALRKIVKCLFKIPYKMKFQPKHEIFEKIGDIFREEKILPQAFIFYRKSLKEKPSEEVYYKKSIVLEELKLKQNPSFINTEIDEILKKFQSE